MSTPWAVSGLEAPSCGGLTAAAGASDSRGIIARRPSPVARRPSPVARRPSPVARRPSPVARRLIARAGAGHRRLGPSASPLTLSPLPTVAPTPNGPLPPPTASSLGPLALSSEPLAVQRQGPVRRHRRGHRGPPAQGHRSACRRDREPAPRDHGGVHQLDRRAVFGDGSLQSSTVDSSSSRAAFSTRSCEARPGRRFCRARAREALGHGAPPDGARRGYRGVALDAGRTLSRFNAVGARAAGARRTSGRGKHVCAVSTTEPLSDRSPKAHRTSPQFSNMK